MIRALQRCGVRAAPALAFAAAIVTAFVGLPASASASAGASEAATAARFETLRSDPWLLRQFMQEFPKGGDLHNHLDGSVYAENILRWAASDGKCVALASGRISMPPCNGATGMPSVADAIADGAEYRRLIDRYSVRNAERRPTSGHDQFFDTFALFFVGTLGHEGAMIAEAARRRGTENTVYLELMQSFGMAEAARLAAERPGLFADDADPRMLAREPALLAIVERTAADLTRYERDWRSGSHCGTAAADAGCGVTVRYLAQGIRTLPREQVYAQLVLGFLLADRDPRYVGVNLVAPEDDPATLANYDAQMNQVRGLRRLFPRVRVSLHAGELGPGLVPPEDTHDHIAKAVMVAGASRIGHGIDIGVEDHAVELLRYMAAHGILVEINLTSNAVIGGVDGPAHPFELYRKFHVPTALSADDEGVLRIDLSHEYARAASTWPAQLHYRDFKALSRNSLDYGFVEQPVKARLRNELERRFRSFEANH